MDDFDKMATQQENDEAAELDITAMAISYYQLGNYSPKLISQDDLPVDTFIITQREDAKRMQMKRNQVLGTGVVKPDDEETFEKNAREKIAIGEEELSEEEEAVVKPKEKSNTQEVQLENQSYSWSDKYRPRKPRYYNRVHTGYDWNQYNKKHYDIDNPPPKTVQGYKLNVFI